MRVFFKTIFVQLLVNIYVFWWGWKILPDRKYIRIPYILFFVLELTVYLIGFFATDYLPAATLADIMWFGTSWVIFIAFIASFLLGYDLLRFVNKKVFRLFRKKLDLESKKLRLGYFFTVIAFVLCLMVYGNYNFRYPVITEMNLEVDKKSKIDNLRIVMVSDVHVGLLINKKILKRYVDRIMEQKPDLILLVGDIIDYDLKSVANQNMQEEFKRLKAPYGVYGSTGNHEYIKLAEEKNYNKIDWLTEKSGITMLRDTALMVDSAFYIVGREDDKCPERKSLSQIMANVDKRYPIIVMNHEPHFLDEEVNNDADIALYGHTHNGQVFPWNYVVSLFYELSYGYKKKDNTHIYVSSGLGLAGPQYRIGTKSEIVVLDVKFRKK